MNFKEIFGKHYKRLHTVGVLISVMGGVGTGFAVSGIFAILYWLLDIGSLWLGAIAGILIGALAGVLLYFFKYRLTERNAARLIDRYGLEERMITMVELEGEDSALATLQRADAIESLKGVPAESIRIKVPTELSVIVAITLALSISFGVLGILANMGRIPYGKDMFARGVDGSFEVVYTVDEGGWIRGETMQSVGFGESTLAVRAVAADGWMFLCWDDGAKSPERSESEVSSDMVIKAVFVKIDDLSSDEDDSDAADDLPVGSVAEEGGGDNSDELGGEEVKGDGEGGGAKWQDRNQFIDGATYYRDYLEFYYQYARGFFDSETDIPPEIIEYFETYFSGI